MPLKAIIYRRALGHIVPLKYLEYEVYRDLIIIYPKPYSLYLRGSIPSYCSSESKVRCQACAPLGVPSNLRGLTILTPTILDKSCAPSTAPPPPTKGP